MATIVDVARRAGVATSTVSHVLNNTRFVSLDTRRAVLEAVTAVGYTPNTLARSLARSTTNTVGLAVSSTTNRYFSDVINAVEDACSELGMVVLLANTHDDPERETRIVAELHQRRVDGIILAPSCESQSGALAYLREKNVSAVLVDRLPDEGFDAVGVENVDAVGEMVRHLARQGHRHMAFLGGQATFTTARERAEGFQAALQALGLPVEPGSISIGHTSVETARNAAAGMLSAADPVTAFVGGNNLTTIGIVVELRARALRVPEDVALVGFDDFEWADAFEPRLTTMVQPCREIGRAAAALLRKRISEPDAPVSTLRLRPTLVVRDSCGSRTRT